MSLPFAAISIVQDAASESQAADAVVTCLSDCRTVAASASTCPAENVHQVAMPTPSRSGCSAHAAVFGKQRRRRPRARGPAQRAGDHAPRPQQPVHVDAVPNAEAVEHVDHVLGRDVAACALGVRAAAKAGNRRVDRRDAHLEGHQDVGERLAIGVVHVRCQLWSGDVLQDGLQRTHTHVAVLLSVWSPKASNPKPFQP
eukprot:200537-Chlamydomonas_euryale.AAC.3